MLQAARLASSPEELKIIRYILSPDGVFFPCSKTSKNHVEESVTCDTCNVALGIPSGGVTVTMARDIQHGWAPCVH